MPRENEFTHKGRYRPLPTVYPLRRYRLKRIDSTGSVNMSMTEFFSSSRADADDIDRKVEGDAG